MAPNMSLAVNVLMTLVGKAAELLRNHGFDVEILERHHRFKKDAPSGTALQLARIVQNAMGQTTVRHGREGLMGERPAKEIGVHAIRVGDNVGEHTVIFSTLGETLEMTHRAHARDCYVRGALKAAKFLADRPPGRYAMADVLGLVSGE
jgi:4-hydroxy-tetrahydrodipicolinate reductase